MELQLCSSIARAVTGWLEFRHPKPSDLVLHVVPDVYGHAVSTWSAVCSEARHSQFGEGAGPHLCMDEWNRPTPVRRRLSLTQAARGKPISTGLAPVRGTKTRSLEALLQYSAFHL